MILRIPRPVWFLIAACQIVALIYVGSKPGGDRMIPRRLPPGSDKVLHFVAYGGLASLIFRGVYHPDPRISAKPHWGALLVVLIPFLVGAADEINQISVPRRSGDPMDLLADTLGACFVLCVGLLLRARARRML